MIGLGKTGSSCGVPPEKTTPWFLSAEARRTFMATKTSPGWYRTPGKDQRSEGGAPETFVWSGKSSVMTSGVEVPRRRSKKTRCLWVLRDQYAGLMGGRFGCAGGWREASVKETPSFGPIFVERHRSCRPRAHRGSGIWGQSVPNLELMRRGLVHPLLMRRCHYGSKGMLLPPYPFHWETGNKASVRPLRKKKKLDTVDCILPQIENAQETTSQGLILAWLIHNAVGQGTRRGDKSPCSGLH